jgi:hypothetical protein
MSNATFYESSPATSSEFPAPEIDVRINARLFVIDRVPYSGDLISEIAVATLQRTDISG